MKLNSYLKWARVKSCILNFYPKKKEKKEKGEGVRLQIVEL
jgi:hypothetical protein